VRLLVVTNRLDLAGGGTARKAMSLAEALSRRGTHVTLLTSAHGITAGDRSPDPSGVAIVTVRHLGRRWPVPLMRPTELRRLVAGCDVVLLLNHWTAINLLIAWVARRLGRPYVVMPCGALTIIGRSRTLKRLYNVLAGNRLVALASAWIATTLEERATFQAYGVEPRLVDVIPNAIDVHDRTTPDPSRFRSIAGIATAPYVLYMGRLSWNKGPDLLLDAWARIAGAAPHHLILAGPAGDAASTVCRRLDVEGRRLRAHWVGEVDRRTTVDAYIGATVLVVPSRLEAMSLVALEAGAAGCPVILTTACGFNDVAAHGGLTVPPDVEGLAAAILAAVRWSDAERTARGVQLRRYVEQRFDWDTLLPRYEAVLGGVTGHSAMTSDAQPAEKQSRHH
jgi:glycosyltransferase involved in cell wall biosynthesis